MSLPSSAPPAPVAGLRVGLALGSGGARGLAHVAVLEVLDEFGIVPWRIAGTSMGAIIGATRAAGLSGHAIRAHVLDSLRDRPRVMTRLLQARVGKLADLLARGNPVLVDGEKLLDLFWPEQVPDRFEDLGIPFVAVATDYAARQASVFSSGALVTGVAASMAIPGLLRPVTAHDRTFIDGGATNPLPFELVAEGSDLVIAVDVTGGPPEGQQAPEGFQVVLGAAQIMQSALVGLKLESRRPDILVRPAIEGFGALDFFKARAILAAADAVKEGLRAEIAAALDRLSAAPRKNP